MVVGGRSGNGPWIHCFLLGVGIGFISEEYVTCPHCGCEFLAEELDYSYEQGLCPACREPLGVDDEDNQV